MSNVANISFYKFLDLSPEELPGLRESLLTLCQEQGIKGTILLAPEGINVFVAAPIEAIRALQRKLESDPRFDHLPYKISYSEKQPYRRMLVKIKKEIIAFGVDGIRPRAHTAPRIEPKELKSWYETGKDFLILDTRNDYELKTGTFQNAHDMNLKTFRQFPEEAEKLPNEWKKKPVVTFCTGGIRCEKAAAFLEQRGFEEVYQLNGGILKYFEECGDAYYNGECFVFDHRVGVNGKLEQTATALCYNCQMPVLPMEQRLAEYVKGKHCPHCVNGKNFHKEKIAKQVAEMRALRSSLSNEENNVNATSHQPTHSSARKSS